MTAARVEQDGKVKALDGKAEPDEVISEDDAKEPAKVAKLFVRILKDIAALKRRFVAKRVDFEDVVVGGDGTVTQLAHNFAGRVRWSVVGWQTSSAPTTDDQLCYATTWMMRALWGGLTLASTAGNFTVGARFRVSVVSVIVGARFLWKASTRTVKVTLWRDSDGAVLGFGTVACTDSGCYTVTFAAPVVISGADLNVDLTLGVYDLAGAVFTNTGADAVWQGYLPLTLPGFSLRTNQLFLAGDNRPTTTVGGGLNWVEPILAVGTPQLIEDTTKTDGNTLALASYATGKATIRVEAAG